MFSGDRPDGTLVRKAPKVRLFMPYLMPRRGDATIYLKQKIDVTHTQDYLKRWNDGTRPRLFLTHLYVAACVRMFKERPRANRFIAGRRLYQRNDIAISLSVMKSRSEDAKLTVVKETYAPDAGLRQVHAQLKDVMATGRSAEKTSSEREIDLLSKLPRWVIPIAPKLQKLGDWLNVTPASLPKNDPLYASMMISHGGTIGLESAYHHLYEHGTVPIFAVIGPVRDEPVVNKKREIEARPIVTVRCTFDERVTDGHYAARAIARQTRLVEQPWLLETDEDDGPGAPEGF